MTNDRDNCNRKTVPRSFTVAGFVINEGRIVIYRTSLGKRDLTKTLLQFRRKRNDGVSRPRYVVARNTSSPVFVPPFFFFFFLSSFPLFLFSFRGISTLSASLATHFDDRAEATVAKASTSGENDERRRRRRRRSDHTRAL